MTSLLCLLLAAAPLPLWQDVSATSVSAETRRTEVIYYPTREEALELADRLKDIVPAITDVLESYPRE